MPIKIPQLPSIPAGTITGQTSIPVAKTSSDPKTYKMTLDQTLTWLQANGVGAGFSGYSGFVGAAGFSGFSGVAGPAGSGSLVPGQNSYGVQLVASSYVFQASGSATVNSLTAIPYTPTTITLDAQLQNLTGTATFAGKLYDINNNFIGNASFGGAGNNRTLTNTQFGSAYSCQVTASLVSGSNTYYDITTITRLTDATNVLQGYLSNPVAVLAANNDGTLGAGEQAKATGQFVVYYGLNELTSGVTYSVVSQGVTSSSASPSSVNFTINATTGIYQCDSITAGVDGASALFRAQAYGINIDKVFQLAKSKQGTTGPAGSAEAVFLTTDTFVFNFDSTGTPQPSSQLATFNATLSILTGTVQWDAIQYYTDGTSSTGTSLLSTDGNKAYLTITNFASALSVGKETQSFLVSATHIASGRSDQVRVSKVKSGGSAFTVFLTNEAHTLGADSTGVVTDTLPGNASGYFKIYSGNTLVDNQYVTYSISNFTTGISAIVYNYPSASAGYYGIASFDSSLTSGIVELSARYTPPVGDPVSFTQIFSLTKAKAGPTGDTGPGIVFRGVYDGPTSYFKTATRRDVVLYPASGGSYYLAASSGTGTSLGTPGSSPGWESFGAQFSSVATGLLLAEDATILKTLVMGYGTGPGVPSASRGIIRSFGTVDWNPTESPQDGFWIGMDSDNYAKFRVGSTSNNLVWDGSTLNLSYGNSGITLYSGSSSTDMYLSMGGANDYDATGIWMGRDGNSTSGVYKLSIKSANGRSLTWDGTSLTTNGATQNLALSGSVYLGKTGPNDLVNTGFWLGNQGGQSYFLVGDSNSYLKFDGSNNTLTVSALQTTDGIIVNSGIGLRKSDPSGSFTITGGPGNGAQYGAQIDLVGNNYTGTGSGGQLVLQAGTGAESTIAFHTNNSKTVGDAIIGVQRMLILNNGRTIIAREPYLSTSPGNSGFNPEAGSLWIRGNASVGPVEPDPSGSGANTQNTNVGKLYVSDNVESPTISATSTLGFVYDSANYVVGTNSVGKRTVTNTSGEPTGGTDGDIVYIYT